MIELKETTDIVLLAQLLEEMQNAHHRLYPKLVKPFETESAEEYFAAVFEDEDCKAFLALFDNEIAGYILLIPDYFKGDKFLQPNDILVIDQLFVKEPFRRKGVANELLRKCLAIAKEQQFQRIQLNHWTANDAARKLFNKFGFSYFCEQMEFVL
jgi:ribosomal protein S18 acetylase RimI-like enzyme